MPGVFGRQSLVVTSAPTEPLATGQEPQRYERRARLARSAQYLLALLSGALLVRQMLDWTGPWGLSFVIALVNASVAGLLLEGVQGFRSGTRGAGDGVHRLTASPPHRLTASAPGRWLLGTVLLVALLTAR